MRPITLSLIFPCYNEQESIETLLNPTIRLIKDSKQVKIEALVVDDGSSDKTPELLENFKDHIRVIKHQKNLGYGAAIKTGLFYSTGDVISFLDFDGTCSPHEALDMLETLVQAEADMVMGIRLHQNSKMPLTRVIGNQLYLSMLKSLYHGHKALPKDSCTGFRVLKRSIAEDLFSGLPNDLSFSPALTSKALKRNYVLKDHQISYQERLGQSKISLIKDGLKFSKALIVERFR